MYKKILELFGGPCLGHWAGNGAVAKIEEKLRTLYGAKYALTVDSATNAILYISLALNLKKSEIITTPLSFGGTISGPIIMENKFHFARIDTSSLTIDTSSISNIIDNSPKVKAVISVEFLGNTFDYKTVNSICAKRGVYHIVDSAQSLGYKYDNSIVNYADAVVLSLGTGKTIDVGEGGAILTNNYDLYKRLIHVCQHPHRHERDCGINTSTEFALNGRINPYAAAIADFEFEHFISELQTKRRKMISVFRLLQGFSSVEEIISQEQGTFYHTAIRITKHETFNKEFANSQLSRDYYWVMANFVPIPEQLLRIGHHKRKVLSYEREQVNDALNNVVLIKPKQKQYE